MTKHRQFCTSSSHTLAGCNSKQVRNKGSDDKQTIIATFTFTHDGQLLGMQLIGRGKTKQSLPRQQSPAEFSLNVNHNHYSNQKESIKFIEEILVPIRIAKPRSSRIQKIHFSTLPWDWNVAKYAISIKPRN